MKEDIKKLMAEAFLTKIENIFDNISQENFPQWDSLKHLNLVVALEEKFALSFEPEEIAEMKSLDKIMTMIAKKRGE